MLKLHLKQNCGVEVICFFEKNAQFERKIQEQMCTINICRQFHQHFTFEFFVQHRFSTYM
jgi:hypothetical protein